MVVTQQGKAAAWSRLVAWPYFGLLVIIILLVPLYIGVVPHHYYSDDNNFRALVIAFLCGALVGATEISSRYRDEQMKAILSPDGSMYMICNGAISTFALILIFHYCPTVKAFSVFQGNSLGAAIGAGFGATAIMRTRFAVIKGSDNKEISIGPDIVISLLLSMIDRRIDRWRASRRQQIIADHFNELRALGTVSQASDYLIVSLLSFQNLIDLDRKQLSDTINSNKTANFSYEIQLATLGFLFLTIVGEENFASVLEKANQLQGASLLPTPPSPPSPPAVPSSTSGGASPPIVPSGGAV